MGQTTEGPSNTCIQLDENKDDIQVRGKPKNRERKLHSRILQVAAELLK
jgi:hypothetical protein